MFNRPLLYQMHVSEFSCTAEWCILVNLLPVRLGMWNDVRALRSQLKMLITVNYSGHGWLKKTMLHCHHLNPGAKSNRRRQGCLSSAHFHSPTLNAVCLTCYFWLSAVEGEGLSAWRLETLLITLGAGRPERVVAMQEFLEQTIQKWIIIWKRSQRCRGFFSDIFTYNSLTWMSDLSSTGTSVVISPL